MVTTKKINKNTSDRLRQRINVIIHGVNTPAGKLFDIVLLFIILLSVMLVLLETVKNIDKKFHDILIVAEWAITIFFTFEYFLRIISTRKAIILGYGIIAVPTGIVSTQMANGKSQRKLFAQIVLTVIINHLLITQNIVPNALPN